MYVLGPTGQAIFVHLACSILGCPAVCVNGPGTVDEIWQLCDIAEATVLVAEPQFMQKVKPQLKYSNPKPHCRQKTYAARQ